MGDMNYRVDLDNDTARSLAQKDDFDGLLAADQVRSRWVTESLIYKLEITAQTGNRLGLGFPGF